MAACLLALAVGAAFWIPAFPAARGYFPAPLDDVYIHFDFARSLAQGHPFEWVPGNGYSSGETAPLYAAVLAVGFRLGFTGRALGWFAGGLAVLAVASFVRSVQRLVRPCPTPLALLLGVFVLSIGIVDWTLFSGMEVALFAAVLGRTLLALATTRARLDERAGLTRERAQWRLGAWGGLLVLLRPEAGVLVALFAVVAARGAQRRSGLLAMGRAALPGAFATALVLGVNRVLTGETQSAGAVLKLLSSNPYLSDVDRARAFVENLLTFALIGLRAELTTVPLVGLALPLLALLGVVVRERRMIAGTSALGALAWMLVVSFNNNSTHHNFRYYTPAYLLLLVAASAGAATLASVIGRRRGTVVACAVVGVTAVAFAARIPAQSRFFARATENIRDQQIEIALRLGRRLAPRDRVLLGDAGAIPFVSQLPALDAMGLGGYARLPFARAAANGEASIVELLEHVPVGERPTYLALYPNWFGLITSRFGVELERVTLEDNVICAGAAKVIYRADWSALESPRDGQRPQDEYLVDELDVADVLSEREHRYASPAPLGGWTTLDILDDEAGARRFDGGRIIPATQSESFVFTPSRRVDEGVPLHIVVRVDDAARGMRVRSRNGVVDLALDEPVRGAWQHARGTLLARAGEMLILESSAGFRDYHVWIRTNAR